MAAAGRQPTVASLVKQYAPAFVTHWPQQAVPQVQSTLAKLSLCRTAALGGRRLRCESCDHETTVWNSCGDRHCPQCAGAKRADWMNSACELLLPNVDDYQVVFTLPQQLARLALGNRRTMYGLLFQSAWKTLQNTIADEQQYEAAAMMVLHTWNQQLEHHPHVHAVVPGGGPSLQNAEQWKNAEPPPDRPWMTNWLVDADTLKAAFCKTYLHGLKRLHRRGELKLEGEWSQLLDTAIFEEWLQPLEDATWVVHIEAPPQNCVPENIVKYLARYLTGGPISDSRLVSHENGHITFTARRGTTSGGDRRDVIPVRLPGEEFVRRWSLHILPKGFVKSRRYGGWSNRHRQSYVQRCEALLVAAQQSGDVPASVSSPPDTDEPAHDACPECGGRMSVQSASHRRSWRMVMNSSARPPWYERDRMWKGPVTRTSQRKCPV